MNFDATYYTIYYDDFVYRTIHFRIYYIHDSRDLIWQNCEKCLMMYQPLFLKNTK